MVAKTKPQNSSNRNPNEPEGEDGFLRISLVNQAVFVRKRKSCPLKDIPLSELNYTNLKLLNKFLTERGKIIPGRVTNVAMKKQRALSNAIKIARQLALLSPIAKEE
jgi:small subunit ribosomal protein S18